MIDVALLNGIIISFLNFIGFVLAITVYLFNQEQKTNRIFFWWVTTLIFWIDCDFLSAFAKFYVPGPYVYTISLWAARLCWFFVSLFFIFTYFFIINFPRELERKRSSFDIIHTVVWMTWAVVSFTDLIVKDVGTKEQIASQYGGIGQIPILLTAVFSLIFFYFNLFRKYPQLDREEKTRVQYFLAGSSVFGFFAIVFNIVMPIMAQGNYTGTWFIYGEYSSIFLFGLTAYAIIKKQLFGVKIIFTEILVTIIGLIILISPFFAKEPWLKITYIVVFLFFCIFSFLLVQNMIQETIKKEQLEAEIQQRIKEVEKANKRLEEAKAVLEIRIQARTKELKDLAVTLDQQVKGRTKELEDKLQELERANHLMVGRELIMIDLKKQNAQLQEKIAELQAKQIEKTINNAGQP